MKGKIMQNNQLPRREREKARQRREMLEAALYLFSEKGYHNVSMQQIAEKSEFAIGTLYNFFKNKEHLYKALVLEKAESINKEIKAAIETKGDYVEKLRNYVKVKGETFRNNVRLIRLYFSECQGASFNLMAGLDSDLRDYHNEALKDLSSIFADGMRKKQFNKIADPSMLAVALDGMTTAFLLEWLVSPEHHPYPEDPDIILNIFLKGLTAT